MDAPLVPLPPWKRPKPLRWTGSVPYLVQVRFRSRDGQEAGNAGGELLEPEPVRATDWREGLRKRVRDSRLKGFFSEYRPYEDYGPGPLSPDLASTPRDAGFSYMLSKSGFGRRPGVVYRDGDFVALNYTAGRWDGWTPFETVNGVGDLRRAERFLLARGRPGWLMGTLDTCLWAFSGELWQTAPGLAAIARFAAEGGASGRLVNVPPRVVARYARLIEGTEELSRSTERAATPPHI